MWKTYDCSIPYSAVPLCTSQVGVRVPFRIKALCKKGMVVQLDLMLSTRHARAHWDVTRCSFSRWMSEEILAVKHLKHPETFRHFAASSLWAWRVAGRWCQRQNIGIQLHDFVHQLLSPWLPPGWTSEKQTTREMQHHHFLTLYILLLFWNAAKLNPVHSMLRMAFWPEKSILQFHLFNLLGGQNTWPKWYMLPNWRCVKSQCGWDRVWVSLLASIVSFIPSIISIGA